MLDAFKTEHTPFRCSVFPTIAVIECNIHFNVTLGTSIIRTFLASSKFDGGWGLISLWFLLSQ